MKNASRSRKHRRYFSISSVPHVYIPRSTYYSLGVLFAVLCWSDSLKSERSLVRCQGFISEYPCALSGCEAIAASMKRTSPVLGGTLNEPRVWLSLVSNCCGQFEALGLFRINGENSVNGRPLDGNVAEGMTCGRSPGSPWMRARDHKLFIGR
jgi:hypothetical protein